MRVEGIKPDGVPVGPMCYSPVVRAGQFAFTSGQLATDFVRGVPPELMKDPNFPNYLDETEKQAHFVYGNLRRCLEAAGSSMEDAVKIVSWHTDQRELGRHIAVRTEYFGPEGPPPSAAIEIAALPVKDAKLEIDLIGLTQDAGVRKEVIDVTSVPEPVHTAIYGRRVYSHCVRAGDFVFTGGTVATDFRSSVAPQARFDPNLPFFGSAIKRQTRTTLNYIKAILQDAGTSMDNVVKCDVYLADISHFAGMDEVWAEFFPKEAPARNVIQLTSLVIPQLIIEISAIAVMPNGKAKKEVITTSGAPQPRAHESQAVKAGNYLFLSGLLATDWQSGMAAGARVNPNHPFQESSARKQTEFIIQAAKAICKAGGTSLSNAVRRKVFLTNLQEFNDAEDVWREHLSRDHPPALSIVGVKDPMLVPECTIQADIIAAIAE